MRELKLTDEQIEVAAEWWADRVCSPVFDGLTDTERKDPQNDSYQMAEVLAMLAVKPVEDDARSKFVAALKTELQDATANLWYGLSVDYNPCQILARAAEEAGIPASNFPWKTSMTFSEDGGVTVSLGYRSPSQELITKEGS